MAGALGCVFMVAACLIRYSSHSRIHDIHYASDATCISVETTLTCTGDGTLTQAVVRAAGAYSLFTKAIIKNDISVLGGSAFLLCSSLSEIELPTTLVEMQGGVFDCCPIINLSIPTTVTTIKSTTVNNCPTFRNFMVNGNLDGELPNHMVKDGFLLSKDSKSLIATPTGKMNGETLKLPSGIETVGDACRWSRAKRIEVPDSVLTINASAFYRAFMETLKLGKLVNSFSSTALEACNSLKSIEMGGNTNFFMSSNVFGKGSASSPSDILKVFEPADKIENTNPLMSSLATGALQLCSTLKSITFAGVPSGKTAVYKSLLTNKIVARYITDSTSKKSEWAIVACVGGATSIDLGSLSATDQNTYKWIYTSAFRGCKLLTELKLHSKVTKVGSSFARECSSLAKIGFAGCYCGNAGKAGTNGANIIPDLSFQGCVLTNILSWPSGDFSIGREVFGSSKFTAIGFPSGLTSIGNDAFVTGSLITKLIFNDKLEKICTGAFRNCGSLNTIEFGSASQLKYVESMAFAYCTALTTITFPDSATTPMDINPNCFAYSSSLTAIKFKTNTGPYRSDGVACYKRESSNSYHTLVICPPGLQEFEFDKQTYTIGTHAFYGCSKLISVKMSNIVETIEDSAFYECHAIEFVRLTPSIKIIGKSAFDSCKRLKHILYCSDNPQVTYTWDPFPTNPNIYLWHDYPNDKFCGHPCFAILDRQCNIPTQYFTEVVDNYAPTVIIQQFIGITTATLLCPDLW